MDPSTPTDCKNDGQPSILHVCSPVGQDIEVEHIEDAQLCCGGSQDTQHAQHEGVTGQHHALLAGLEQVAVGVVVAAGLAWGASPQIERKSEQRPGELQAPQAAHGLHLIQLGLGSGVPALIILHVAVVAMVLAVADAPSCGRQNVEDKTKQQSPTERDNKQGTLLLQGVLRLASKGSCYWPCAGNNSTLIPKGQHKHNSRVTRTYRDRAPGWMHV